MIQTSNTYMFLERFKEVENFTITKLPLGGSKKCVHGELYKPLFIQYEHDKKFKKSLFEFF